MSQTGWCLPTVIYVTLATISILASAVVGRYDHCNTLLVGEVIHGIFWATIMYLLCYYGYSTISWIILLIPLILMVAIILFFDVAMLGVDKNHTVSVEHNYVMYY
jgi:hypothetical protein